ncbi:MAG TPA: GTPase CgtA, partial [Ruminococcaceae bacterium]|nr:GTPase CgtA [Oscillospiraceae bacterium]
PDPVSPDKTAGEQEKTVEIIKNGNVFTVKAEWLVPVLRTINFAEEDSVRYFQRVLMKSGVDDALSKAGVQEGDTVSIYGVEFDYID